MNVTIRDAAGTWETYLQIDGSPPLAERFDGCTYRNLQGTKVQVNIGLNEIHTFYSIVVDAIGNYDDAIGYLFCIGCGDSDPPVSYYLTLPPTTKFESLPTTTSAPTYPGFETWIDPYYLTHTHTPAPTPELEGLNIENTDKNGKDKTKKSKGPSS